MLQHYIVVLSESDRDFSILIFYKFSDYKVWYKEGEGEDMKHLGGSFF